MTQKSVLVLNADLAPLHKVSINHAILMVYRGVAEIHESVEETTLGGYILPKILRLVRYVYAKWKVHRPPKFSKKGVFLRDKRLCSYCGKKAATIDHVIPRALGGISSWANCVASCLRCNTKKGNKLLKDVGMKLLVIPRVPSYEEFFDLEMPS